MNPNYFKKFNCEEIVETFKKKLAVGFPRPDNSSSILCSIVIFKNFNELTAILQFNSLRLLIFTLF